MKIGRGMKKVSDELISELYNKLGNVWLVGKEAGLCGQSVHERLVRLGKINPIRIFDKNEMLILESEYAIHRDAGKLDLLAQKMGRTKQFICRKAKQLGLTDQGRPRPYAIKPESDPYMRNHARVRSLRGQPKKCEICATEDPREFYEWANLSGKYDDPGDYKRMCRKCHRQYDKSRR